MLAINLDGTYFITIDNVKTNDVCTLLARIYYRVLSSFNAIKNYCLVERDSMIRLLSYNRLCFVWGAGDRSIFEYRSRKQIGIKVCTEKYEQATNQARAMYT